MQRLLSVPAPWALLAALAAVLAVLPSGSAWGSTLVKYRLANEGSTPISRLDFRIEPPGAVIPVTTVDPATGQSQTGSPVTVLPTSSGFDTSKLSVALGSGSNVQGLRLLFGQTQTTDAAGQVTTTPMLDSAGQPVGLFQPGAMLDFALNADPATADSLALILPEAARGLSLRRYATESTNISPNPGTGSGGTTTPIDPGTGTGSGGVNTVPEPASVALWGGAAIAGFFGFRRRQAGR